MEISYNNDSIFVDIDSISFRNLTTAIDISAILGGGGGNILNIKSTNNGSCVIATDNFRLNSLAGHDGSYVQLDEFGNLSASDSNFHIFDASFHALYQRQTDINNERAFDFQHMNDIDSSYTDISNAFIQVKSMLDTFDTSVVKVNTTINLFDTSMTSITISFEKVDTSLNYLNSYSTDISNSLYQLRHSDLSYIIIDGYQYSFPPHVDNATENNILLANHAVKSFEWETYRILDGSQDLSLNNSIIYNNLYVSGQTELSNNVYINGIVDVVGDLSLSGNVDIIGDLSLSGSIDVIGDLSLTGKVDVIGDISLVGDTSISKNLIVAYDISADTLKIRGTDVSINYIHDVIADISGKQETFLNGTYNTNLNQVTTSIDDLEDRVEDNEAAINIVVGEGADKLQINNKRFLLTSADNPEQSTGNASPGKTYNILRWNDKTDGDRAFIWENYRVLDGSHDLSINHLDISGGINTSGDLNVTGDTEISGNVNVFGDCDISGNTIIHDGTVDISGDTTIIGKIDLSGATDLSGTMHITHNLDISNNLSIENSTSTQYLKLNEVEIKGHVSLRGATNVIEYDSASISNLEFKSEGDISGAIITPNGTKIRFI
uniref:Uncharacterized protein n=1 Tax=viral metagenome TaxID=1070528 RepID=A0A6C0BXU7_9ZZZZ